MAVRQTRGGTKSGGQISNTFDTACTMDIGERHSWAGGWTGQQANVDMDRGGSNLIGD